MTPAVPNVVPPLPMDQSFPAVSNIYADPGIAIKSLRSTALLAIGLIAIAFCMQERIGINLADEGYLWYGVQRVLAGEVPGLDFHAYEPGRYFWDAAGAIALRSDSLLNLRIANAAFAAVGLFLALLAVRTAIRSWSLLTLFGVILVLWLFPRHKVFEHAIAMAGVFMAVQLIRYPSLLRHALAGTFVGLVTFFGRNHGLYMGISFSLLIFFIYFRIDPKTPFPRATSFIGGIIIGLIPLFAMFIFVPGFWHAVAESVLLMIQGTETQKALSIPWPWRLTGASFASAQGIFQIGTSLGFLMMPVLLIGVLLQALVMPRSAIKARALLIGSAFIGITYIHHAFSRADFPHQAQAMHPVLLCAIGLIATSIQNRRLWRAGAVVVLLLLFTASTAMLAMPLVEYWRLPPAERAVMLIDGQEFRVALDQKLLLTKLRQEVSLHVKPGESFAAAPVFPFAYAYMHARSPWWDIYHLFARDESWQNRMIQALKDRRVSLIMLATDISLDNREDLKFPNTHPLVWKYIQKHYVPQGPPDAGVRFWSLAAPTQTISH